MRRLLVLLATVITGVLLAAGQAYADGSRPDIRIQSADLLRNGSVLVTGRTGHCADSFFVVVRVTQGNARASGATPGFQPCGLTETFAVSTEPSTQTGSFHPGAVDVSVSVCTDANSRRDGVGCANETRRVQLDTFRG